MRSVVSFSVSSLVRTGVVLAVAAVAAGCSSDITRLSQPFFKDDEVTGSLSGLPKETVPAQGATRGDMAARAATAPISSAPLNEPPIRASSVEAPNIPRAAGDGFTVVRAEPGDTAYSLSRRHGVSARAIMAANNLTNAEDVRAGQDVRIPPASWKRRAANTPAPRRIEPPRTTQVTAPQPARTANTQAARTDAYVVRSGDTLYSIARRYDLTASDIARHNDMRTNDVLRVGHRLAIPAEGAVRTASLQTGMTDAPRPAAVPAVKPVSPPVENSLQPLPAKEKPASAEKSPEPAKKTADTGKTDRAVPGGPEPKLVRTAAISPSQQTDAAPGTAKLPEPPSLTGADFRWPVRGRLISEFGSKPQGTQNDGINIAVPEGTSVKAAENGVVAYVGNELKGFGNLVLVRHADDWVTAYAHNSQILVRRGDQVSRGQIIAKAGQTGSVRQPQLHFELRKGSRPVDPLRHLAENN